MDLHFVKNQAYKWKILSYRRYLNTDAIHLYGHGFATEHDGDREYYRQLAIEREEG